MVLNMRSFHLCKCDLCVQSRLVQISYTQRRVKQLADINGQYTPNDFAALDKLLSRLHMTPQWMEHLVHCGPMFSLICSGGFVLDVSRQIAKIISRN
jgi:hypothetical protein